MSQENSFQIKSLIDEHNCCRAVNLGSIVTFRWIGKMLIRDILEQPRLSYRKMKALVKTNFGLNVSVGQCRNARRFVLDEIEGSLVGHYEKLWNYGAELLRANPGSTVQIDVDIMPDSIVYFLKMYVCLKGVKDGWIEGCRRVIDIDGCFLKGICRCEVLAAVGRDSNNQIYPLAWAVVVVENKQIWKWFLDLLLDDIELGDGTGLTIISDQHKGLVEAVKERTPGSEHRQCARHIYANFKKSLRVLSLRGFFGLLRKIQAHGVGHFLEDRCCDAVENGISESFNSAISMSWRECSIKRRREKNGTCQSVPPSEEGLRIWKSTKISGISCLHAIATILFLNGNVEDYVSVWFTTGMFGSCYRYTIKPINGADLWPTVVANTILPPRRRRLPGRPKVNRKKCPTEKEGRHTVSKKGGIPKCGHCKQEGHMKRTCPLLNQVTNEVPADTFVANEVEDHEEEYVADDVEDQEEEYVADEVEDHEEGYVADEHFAQLPVAC
uniref:CCHC-type domain-containing protein n=1 Tax=Lactuca sativa TaxID=4236 RepID=A0A9R1UNX4_LACSA|nr:hypothetical protein LSAT_V11C800418530 [Lactuca sativa]